MQYKHAVPKKSGNANGNNPIVFFSCALFCFQVNEIAFFFCSICHRLCFKNDEQYNDIQAEMLANFCFSFMQYPEYLTSQLYLCLHLHMHIYE